MRRKPNLPVLWRSRQERLDEGFADTGATADNEEQAGTPG